MLFIEMSRDEAHGGGAWGFGNCLWSPTRKENGASWPFWSKLRDVQRGDVVLHLRGKNKKAAFVGYSFASGDGFQSTRRPPDPKEWDFAEAFNRVDLTDFTLFHQPISLTDVFEIRREELETYFDANKQLKRKKLNIFYVRQAGRLQCLNGAYLSEADDALLVALFGEAGVLTAQGKPEPVVSVETGTQLSLVWSRLGQDKFSKKLKGLYGNRCCFPECGMTDPRFLVASHIARWCDNETLRGEMGNGLCLCLLHDKAFELGLFTLDVDYRVYVKPGELTSDSPAVQALLPHRGEQIALASVKPLDDALLEHWSRVDLYP